MAFAFACEWCGAQFTSRKRDRRFCGHSCAFKATRGEPFAAYNARLGRKNAERIGDERRGKGTKTRYVKRGGRHEHRVVVEQRIGRRLLPSEIVHHRDDDGKNNADQNLQLTDRPTHARIHFAGVKRPPKTVCKYGHPLVGDNVTITSAGHRRCRECARKYDREWKQAARRNHIQEIAS